MQAESIRTEYRKGVAILKLSRGVTNALDIQLIKQISDNLKEMKDDHRIHSLVIGSSNEKFFSIGFDLPYLFDLSREDFTVFFRTFNRLSLELYTFPKPTVAAITGHATAGGCILALCCDYRYIAKGRKLMGLNEIKLGVPVPYPADCILRSLVGVRSSREIMDSGDFYNPEDALRLGMVDRVLALDQVMPKSLEKASVLGEMPQEAFTIIKRNRLENVEAQIKERLEEMEEIFINRWYCDDVREKLKIAMAKY